MKYFKLYKFVQDHSETQSTYCFEVYKKRAWNYCIVALLLAFSSVTLFWLISRLNADDTLSHFMSVFGTIFLGMLNLFLSFTIGLYVLLFLLSSSNLEHFSLILKNDELQLNKQLSSVEKSLILLNVKTRVLNAVEGGTKLVFISNATLCLSPITKISSWLSYREKREVTGAFSKFIKIPVIDEKTSESNDDNYLERLATIETMSEKFTGKLKKEEKDDSLIIELKQFINKNLFFTTMLFASLISAFLFVVLELSFSNIVISFSVSVTFFALCLFFPNVLFLVSTDKIIIAEDSISLIRNFWWPTKLIFLCKLNELRNIIVVPSHNSASLLLQNEEKIIQSRKYSRKFMFQLNNFIQQFLLENREIYSILTKNAELSKNKVPNKFNASDLKKGKISQIHLSIIGLILMEFVAISQILRYI